MKMKKENNREKIFGVPPEEIILEGVGSRDHFTVHKSAKKGTTSFRITKDLLDSLEATSLKIGKKARLILSIQDHILTCELTKSK